MKWNALLTLPAILSLIGCTINGPSNVPPPQPVISDFCLNAEPIFFDPADRLTRATERKIIKHNEKGARLCGWAPPS